MASPETPSQSREPERAAGQSAAQGEEVLAETFRGTSAGEVSGVPAEEAASADAPSDAPPPEDASGPKLITLHVLSPNLPERITFRGLPISTTIQELKVKVCDTVESRPPADQQRLIYQGRPLMQGATTLETLFGAAVSLYVRMLGLADDSCTACRVRHLLDPPRPSRASRASRSCGPSRCTAIHLDLRRRVSGPPSPAPSQHSGVRPPSSPSIEYGSASERTASASPPSSSTPSQHAPSFLPWQSRHGLSSSHAPGPGLGQHNGVANWKPRKHGYGPP